MTDPNASATTGLGDLLRQLALRRAPADRSPLLAMGELVRRQAEVAQLPLPAELIVAWRALIGEEGRAWQRQAVEVVQQGQSLLLAAPTTLGMATLLLLAAADLAQRPRSSADLTLLLAPSASALDDLARTAASLDALLGGGLPHLALGPDTEVPRQAVPLILTTPTLLHSRILRHHDRAWRWLWPALRRVIIPAADEAPGAALGHLCWLLRRVTRLLPDQRQLQLLLSMQPAPDLLQSAVRLTGLQPTAALAGSHGGVTTWALWRSEGDLAEEALALASDLRAAGLSVQLHGRDELERALLERSGAQVGLQVSSWVHEPAQAVVLPWGGEAALLHELAAAGHRLVVALAEPTLPVCLFQSQPGLLAQERPLPWPQAGENPYVVAAHLRCAAEERPLSEAEVLGWGSEALLERLERRGLLVWLPDREDHWQPVAGDDDPYEQLSPEGVAGCPTPVYDHEGELLDEADPSQLERRLYPGARLPGVRVAAWGPEGSIHLEPASQGWTTPLRRTQVTVRDELAARPLTGTRTAIPVLLRWGKVVVQDEIVARAEWSAGRRVEEVALDPPLALQWSAPACWIELPDAALAHPDAAQLWAAVVPLLLRCRSSDIVACGANGAVYLVEAQPGGRGLAEAIFQRAEETLRLAHATALASAEARPWRGLAQLTLRWMESLFEPLPEPAPSAEERVVDAPASAAGMPATAEPPQSLRALRGAVVRRNRRLRPATLSRPPGQLVHPLPAREPERPPYLKRTQPPTTPDTPPAPPTPQNVERPPAAERRPEVPRETPAPRQYPLALPLRPAPEPAPAAPAQARGPSDGHGHSAEPRREPLPAERGVRPEAPREEPRREPLPAERGVRPEAPREEPRRGPAPAERGVRPEAPREEPRRGPAPAERGVRPEAPREEPRRGPAPAERAAQPETAGPRQAPGSPNRQPATPGRQWERQAPEPPAPREPFPTRTPQGRPAANSRQQPGAREPRDPGSRQEPGSSSGSRRQPAREPRRPERRSTDPPARREQSDNQRRPSGPTPERPPHQPAREQPQLPGLTAGRPERAVPPPEPEPPQVDAAGILERARRMREQREAQLHRMQQPPKASNSTPASAEQPPEARFRAGQRVFCVPYGEGEVQSVRFVNDRELLEVDFPEHGELQIDPGVSLVRLIADGPAPEDAED